ncbi:MAG: exosortase C-terminal domain/associated protein EpsI [Longimicrobiales bacterium]
MNVLRVWATPVLLLAGALMVVGVDTQREMPLRAPLGSVVPHELARYDGRDLEMSPAELTAAGVDAHLVRVYRPAQAAGSPAWFNLYIGYYESQTRGRTIHSPKNCLPGAGWEALANSRLALATAAGPVMVNSYLLRRKDEKAVVLYWYQGRGRVESSEYRVKYDLLRDAALLGRSDEALVRIVVPIESAADEAAAYRFAKQVGEQLLPLVDQALPS